MSNQNYDAQLAESAEANAAKMREALECAEYALKYPNSDQAFALMAVQSALALAPAESVSQDTAMLDWIEKYGIEIGISALAYHEISATRAAIAKAMREIKTRDAAMSANSGEKEKQ